MARWNTKRVGQKPELIMALEHNLTFADDDDVNAMIERRYRLYDYLTNNDYANTMMLQSVIDQWADYVNKLYDTTLYEYDPILNYDRHEEGTETTARHKGTKRSTNVDIKDATATDFKTATATDLKESVNMNSKDSTGTNKTTTTTPRVRRETETTGYGLNSTTGAPVQRVVELAPTGTDQVSESGSAASNYTEHTGLATDNYKKTEGAELANYDRQTGTAADNYTQRTGTAANNYETVTDIDANTYDKDVLSFTNRRTYGNIGTMTTQEMIQRERDIIIECLDVYVSKFAECFDISTDILMGWLSNHDDEGNEEPDYEEGP